MRWPAAGLIVTSRLRLDPLNACDAEEMASLLDDDALHEYIGGHPATLPELRERYRRLTLGHSPDGTEGWLNWIVRHRASGSAVGILEATLESTDGQLSAMLAWVIGSVHQRNGYAKEAATAAVDWLRAHGVRSFRANIHPEHAASIAIAQHLGFSATTDAPGAETRWTRSEI